jgi:Ser/Thr protein kinase RdoA (MazF antagonist)
MGEWGAISLPVESLHKKLIEPISSNHFVVAFEAAKGTSIDVTKTEVWNDDLLYRWGNVMGRMHSAGKK